MTMIFWLTRFDFPCRHRRAPSAVRDLHQPDKFPGRPQLPKHSQARQLIGRGSRLEILRHCCSVVSLEVIAHPDQAQTGKLFVQSHSYQQGPGEVGLLCQSVFYYIEQSHSRAGEALARRLVRASLFPNVGGRLKTAKLRYRLLNRKSRLCFVLGPIDPHSLAQ